MKKEKYAVAKALKEAMDMYGPTRILCNVFGIDGKSNIPFKVTFSVPAEFGEQDFASALPLSVGAHNAACRAIGGPHATIGELIDVLNANAKAEKRTSLGRTRKAEIKSAILEEAYGDMTNEQRTGLCMSIVEENCDG